MRSPLFLLVLLGVLLLSAVAHGQVTSFSVSLLPDQSFTTLNTSSYLNAGGLVTAATALRINTNVDPNQYPYNCYTYLDSWCSGTRLTVVDSINVTSVNDTLQSTLFQTYAQPPASSTSSVQYVGLRSNLLMKDDTCTSSFTASSTSSRFDGIVSGCPNVTSISGSRSHIILAPQSSAVIGTAIGMYGIGVVGSSYGASATVTLSVGVQAQAYTGSISNLTISTAIGLNVPASTGTGTNAITNYYGISIAPTTASNIVNSYGLLISAGPTGATGLKAAIRLADTTGAASGGIMFGGLASQSNLYRSAASTLKTDTALVVGTTLEVDSSSASAVTLPSGGVLAAGILETTSSSSTALYVPNGSGVFGGSVTVATTLAGSTQYQPLYLSPCGGGVGLQINCINGTAVNTMTVTPNTAGSWPILGVGGTDNNIGLIVNTKGTGEIRFAPGTRSALILKNVASSVNFVTVSQSVTGAAPLISVDGSDTNVDLTLSGKGTGGVKVVGDLTTNTISGTGTATFAVGGATISGTGATAVCATSYLCTSLSGTITLTTGTGISATGVFLTITTGITRTNLPNCIVQLMGNGVGITWAETTTTIPITDLTQLTSSTSYTVKYACFGK